MFPMGRFLACQIFELVSSQIETKRIFPLLESSLIWEDVIYNQKTFKNSFLEIKIGPMIVELVVKSHFNLLEFIGIDANQKEKWEQFEGASESHEILKF